MVEKSGKKISSSPLLLLYKSSSRILSLTNNVDADSEKLVGQVA